MPESYFEPKMGNDVRLYMTAECPQLPAFEGRDIYIMNIFHSLFLSPLISGKSIFFHIERIFFFFSYCLKEFIITDLATCSHLFSLLQPPPPRS